MPLPPYTLRRMTPSDAPQTIQWIVQQYGFDASMVEEWVRDLHFDWPLSVLAADPDGRTIGLLNMSSYRIEEETPQIALEAPDLLRRLNSLRYTAVFSFIVAPTYRGTPLNHAMLTSIVPDLRRDYDFVFVPVMHRLQTHSYWKRWGATEFYRDAESVYYRLDCALL